MNEATYIGQAMALTIALVTGSAAALAAPPSNHQNEPVVRITVPSGDLNLASEAGQHMMMERIQRAAKRACDVISSTHVADYHEVFADCYQFAVAGAVAQVHTAQFAATNGEHSFGGGN